eukprot:364283-Chlamydomonas_euryale.AAC.24
MAWYSRSAASLAARSFPSSRSSVWHSSPASSRTLLHSSAGSDSSLDVQDGLALEPASISARRSAMVRSSASSVVRGTRASESCAPSDSTAAAPSFADVNQHVRAPVWHDGPVGSDK